MKTLVLLLFSVMAFANSVSKSPQTLVIIGDSLTEGFGVKHDEAYPYQLQLKMQADGLKWKVINHGISGSTSASALSRVRWVLKNPPDLAILALGANDGLRGVTAESTEYNLDQAIGLFKKAKVKVILAGMKMPPNYGGQFRERFDGLFPKLAKKHDIKLIPFFLDGVGGVAEYNLKDGIHPNAKGHAKIAETIYKAIKTEL